MLEKYKVVDENFENKAFNKKLGWSMPITRKERILYLTWEYASTLFYKSELKRIAYHFYILHQPSFIITFAEPIQIMSINITLKNYRRYRNSVKHTEAYR